LDHEKWRVCERQHFDHRGIRLARHAHLSLPTPKPRSVDRGFGLDPGYRATISEPG
jgi:hypothetical protein